MEGEFEKWKAKTIAKLEQNETRKKEALELAEKLKNAKLGDIAHFLEMGRGLGLEEVQLTKEEAMGILSEAIMELYDLSYIVSYLFYLYVR
ncbi:MAG: hypothetical protein JTT12_05645 [Candidatus Brockarchaeota archaeon]|nr:hypothetical protein [Candidatus Brockarchaeota archaeon]